MMDDEQLRQDIRTSINPFIDGHYAHDVKTAINNIVALIHQQRNEAIAEYISSQQ